MNQQQQQANLMNSTPNEDRALLMKIEALAFADMSHKLSFSCFDKCVNRVNDGELHVGELTCLDRCSLKYMHAQEIVNNTLANLQPQQQQQ